MDADSCSTNTTKSVLRTVLTGCLHPSHCSTTPEKKGQIAVNLPEKLSAEDNCQQTTIQNRIHILISDQDGMTLFDSDRYIQSLHVLVYDQSGKLFYSSVEHSKNRNSQSQKALSKQKTRRTETEKCKKENKKCAVKDNDCVKKYSDVPPREMKRNKSSQITQTPYVAIERLKDFKGHITDTASGNDSGIVDSSIEACVQGVSATIPQGKSSNNDPRIVNVSVVSKINRHNDGLSVDNTHNEANTNSLESVDVYRNGTEKLPGFVSAENEIDLTEALTCNICGIKYKSQMMLNRHKQVHALEHTDLDNPLQCPTCKKVYTNWRSLTIHRRKHDAVKDNVCGKCGKGFRTKQELVRHEFVHSSTKSSPCHVCGKLFKNKAYAQMHSKLHSAENRKHICKLCGKHFLRGPDIQKHMRIHTGEKPFICSQCGRSFSESSHLIRHERLHTGEKPYKCERCDLRFTHKEVLIRHTFTHMEHLPFSCEVCNKGFKTKRELDHHWLVHDKPTDPALKETCQVCGKVFSHVLYLRYHMRTHNNLGRFQCLVCGKVFKKASYLKQHTINQHADSAQALEPDFGLEADKTNPALVSVSVNNIIEPVNCTDNGISSEHYTYMSTEISRLLKNHTNIQG